MKRVLLILFGIILLFLIYRGIVHEEPSNKANTIPVETEEQPELVEETQNNNQKYTENARKVISNTDRLNRMPKYEAEGMECKAIEDTIERGDCFQKINEYYLTLQVRESKDQFYFPFIRDQDDWKDVFHLPVEENDQLGGLKKEEHYDYYVDEFSTTGTNDQRGIDRIHDFWYVFSALIPREYRPDLKRIYWSDTGEIGAFGFGWEEVDPPEHYLMLSTNTNKYHGLFKGTLIHEFAHLLTLTADQIDIIEESDEFLVWEREQVTVLHMHFGDCV